MKEALNRVYRVRGRNRAKRALAALTDSMAFSNLPELRTLRRTAVYWRKEMLAYFYCRLTNARTEAALRSSASPAVLGTSAALPRRSGATARLSS